MKMTTLKSVAIAVGLASTAFGQATSPVVGYSTTIIDDEFGVGSPKTSLIAPSFVNPAVFSGSISSIEGAVLSFDGASFVAGEFNQLPESGSIPVQPSYYLITDDGFWANIVSNGEGDVELAGEDAVQFTAADNVSIRKHITLSQFFGDISSTVLTPAAFDPGAADNIILLDGGNTLLFYPDNSGSLDNTFVSTAFDGADEVAIQPDQGLQVVRRSGGEAEIVFAGTVEVNPRMVTVGSGVNVLPVVLPTDTTMSDISSILGSFDGVDGLVSVGSDFDTSSADSIQVVIDGNTSTFFGNNTGTVPGSFIDSTFTTQDDFEIPNGAAVVVTRNGESFTWVIPSAL